MHYFLFHFTSHEVPCRHFLQRTSYRLNIPQQEDEQYGNADQTGDAVELTDADHQKLSSIVGQPSRQIISHLVADTETVQTRAHRSDRTIAYDTSHRQSHEEMLEWHQLFQINSQHTEEDGISEGAKKVRKIQRLDGQTRIDEEVHHDRITDHGCHTYRE